MDHPFMRPSGLEYRNQLEQKALNKALLGPIILGITGLLCAAGSMGPELLAKLFTSPFGQAIAQQIHLAQLGATTWLK